MIQTNQKFKNCHKSPETHRGHFFFQWRDRILLLNSKYRIVHVVPTVFGGRGGRGQKRFEENYKNNVGSQQTQQPSRIHNFFNLVLNYFSNPYTTLARSQLSFIHSSLNSLPYSLFTSSSIPKLFLLPFYFQFHSQDSLCTLFTSSFIPRTLSAPFLLLAPICASF